MQQPIILPWAGKWPTIGEGTFVAPNATLIGDLEIGQHSSIWFGVVIRADVHEIRIGARTNIQDGTVIHATESRAGTYIGDGVTIGHAVMLHACRIESDCLIGMHATILDEAIVEAGGFVAGGAVVTPGKRVLSGELWAGNPARKMRDLSAAEQAGIRESATRYTRYADGYIDLLAQTDAQRA